MQVIGKQRVDYKNKDGKVIQGVRLWACHEKNGVIGVVSEEVYLSDNKLAACGLSADKINVDDDVTVLYNRYGSVESITVNN